METGATLTSQAGDAWKIAEDKMHIRTSDALSSFLSQYIHIFATVDIFPRSPTRVHTYSDICDTAVELCY